MKIVISILGLLSILFLFGCGASVKSEVFREDVFKNFENLEYKVTEYTLTDNATAHVIDGYYMPEIGTVCFNIVINNPTEIKNYEVIYKYVNEDEKINSSNSHIGISVDSNDGTAQICNNELEYDYYEILINRINKIGSKRITLASIYYNDELFSNRDKITTSLLLKEPNEVELNGNANITFDFKIDGIKENINGDFVLKVFDNTTNKEVFEKRIYKKDLIFNGNISIIKDYKVDGLVPGNKYNLIMFYDPMGDSKSLSRINFEYANSSTMIGLTEGCFSHFLCADIYDTEFLDNTTVFKTFVVNNESYINKNTNEPHTLIFKVYNNINELVYSVPLEHGQESVEVPNEYLFANGRIEVESDILIKEPCSSSSTFLILSYKYLEDE